MNSFNCLIPSLAGLLAIAMSCQKIVPEVIDRENIYNGENLRVVTHEYTISPKVTDPAITTVLADHFASVQEGRVLKNTLYLFLPGTHRTPAVCKATTRKAASMGYHSIGLMYDNLVAGNRLCSASGDITCHRRARHEVIDGIDRHASVNVNYSNSLINRLYKLLVYLNRKYPSQGWSQYILNGKPNWSKIIVAGHSQGGAVAGVLGKFYPVKRVIMISMIDFLNNGKIPDWLTMPANRPKYFAITHVGDELVPYEKIKVGWSELGMAAYGKPVNVDVHPYPYDGSHTLITTADPTYTGIDKYHNSTGVDVYIPKDVSGKYIYDKAFEYLINYQTLSYK